MAHPGVYLITAAVGVIAGLFIYFSSHREDHHRHYEHRNANKSNNEFIDKDSQCTICLEPIQGDFNRLYLRCGHSFHNACLMRWNHIKDTCPLCNKRTGIDI